MRITCLRLFQNANVKELIFAENSKYTGVAADLSKSPGFKFNGNYVDGKAAGTVKVEKQANVSLNLAPKHSNDSYYFPAFQGKYYQIVVDEQATLAIDSAGTAIKI